MPVPEKWSAYLRQHNLDDNEVARALAENLEDPAKATIGWFTEAIQALELDRITEEGIW